MFCPNCGSEIEDNSAFCSKCGASTGKVNNQQVLPNTANSVVVKTNKSTKKVIIILSILLMIGAVGYYMYFNSPKQKILGTWYTVIDGDSGTFTFDKNGVLTCKDEYDQFTMLYTIDGKGGNQATILLFAKGEEPEVGQVIFINRNYVRIIPSRTNEVYELHR